MEMDLRTTFALAAMQGMVQSGKYMVTPKALAELAYTISDAMTGEATARDAGSRALEALHEIAKAASFALAQNRDLMSAAWVNTLCSKALEGRS